MRSKKGRDSSSSESNSKRIVQVIKEQQKEKEDPFYFKLPPEKIAQNPIDSNPNWRDEARLMVLHRDNDEIEHRRFKDIVEYFGEGDLFVMNDTKVVPALLKVKSRFDISVILLREIDHADRIWEAFITITPPRHDGKVEPDIILTFGTEPPLRAKVLRKTANQNFTLQFQFDGTDEAFRKALSDYGMPYIPQWVKPLPTPADKKDYQTIFAKAEGAISAPGAGLHFSPQILLKMEVKGIRKSFLTLHTGIGHFRTAEVRTMTPKGWKVAKNQPPSSDTKRISWSWSSLNQEWIWMESEHLIIDEAAAAGINMAKRRGGRVVAIGASVIRGLETAPRVDGDILPFDGWTGEFIRPTTPPFSFHVTDAIISNFHIPKSPSLMCVAAFGGYDRVMNAYKEAIAYKEGNRKGYRFGPYGDAMLIL
jgi:S-adenosylmethionine:tRNA ribosyltransferase-isomerase